MRHKRIVRIFSAAVVLALAFGALMNFSRADAYADEADGYKTGDIITLGTVPDFSDYLPDGDACIDGRQPDLTVPPAGINEAAVGLPIKWQIVDVVDEDKVILLATNVIASMWNITNFSHGRANDTDFWKTSNIRKFLNGGVYAFTFEEWGSSYWVPGYTGYTLDHKGGILGKAFTEEERALLLDYVYDGADDLNGAADKVVVPSVTEIAKWKLVEGVDMKAGLIGNAGNIRWHTRTPSETTPNVSMYLVDIAGYVGESNYNGLDRFQDNLGPRPAIMLPMSYFEGGVTVTDPGGSDDPGKPKAELGFAQEYDWDGVATDGSGKLMKDDPRIVIFDDFSDYNGVASAHIKGSYSTEPKRWIGSEAITLDATEKFSGDYGLKIPVNRNSNAFGNSVMMFVDSRALRGLPMNGEEMTGLPDMATGPDGIALSSGVNPREGGFEELYGRAMVKYASNFNFNVSAHNGLHFSGGYSNRPGASWSQGQYTQNYMMETFGKIIPDHPGSSAAYRSNGFDRWMAGLEPEYGNYNIYFYGAEQVGTTGNHVYPTGEVAPSTGGDSTRPVNRVDGVNGFKSLPNYRPRAGQWNCVEFYVKMNTVINNGTSPGPNVRYDQSTLGPQPVPEDCVFLADGVLKVWVNGVVVLEYTDVVFRYTDTMIIDMFSLSTYFGAYNNDSSAVYYDNVVVATEYIGPINTGDDTDPEPRVYEVGDEIEFIGKDWVILDIEDDIATVIGADLMTSMWWGTATDWATALAEWDTSSIRTYLNNYYNNLGNAEQSAIQVWGAPELDASGSGFNKMTVQFATGDDKIVIPSIREIEAWFGFSRNGTGSDPLLAAKLNGTAMDWWLRSVAGSSQGIGFISAAGAYDYWTNQVYMNWGSWGAPPKGVRAVLKLDLNYFDDYGGEPYVPPETGLKVYNEVELWSGRRDMQILWNDMQTVVDFRDADSVIKLSDVVPGTVFTVYYEYDQNLLAPWRIAQKLGLCIRHPGYLWDVTQIFSSAGTQFYEDKFQVTYENIVNGLGAAPSTLADVIKWLSVEIHHNNGSDWDNLEAPVTITRVTFGEYVLPPVEKVLHFKLVGEQEEIEAGLPKTLRGMWDSFGFNFTAQKLKPGTVFTIYYESGIAPEEADKVALRPQPNNTEIYPSNGAVYGDGYIQVPYEAIANKIGVNGVSNVTGFVLQVGFGENYNTSNLSDDFVVTKITFGNYERETLPEFGFAADYRWDGPAADGSGQKMKDDPRIIIMDNFSDYETGRLRDHVLGTGSPDPKRWMGGTGLSLDQNESYTGNYSMKITATTGTSGGSLSQWLDLNALKGLRMNDEPMTAIGNNAPDIPEDGMPVYDVAVKEGGYEELFARAMVKYADGFDLYGHNGIHVSGGYSSRPDPGRSGGSDNPGSNAGYRSNGYDRFTAGLEPEFTFRNPDVGRPGAPSIYYYGAEQLGASGNHMFGNGTVYGSTGGDNDLSLSRTDGVNGFTAYPAKQVPVGEWYCLEFHIKLNTVIENGTSPGPNEMPVWTPTRGPQAQPDDCVILHDGVLQAWINGVMVMDYNDVVFRYTDTMIIDYFSLTSYFGNNSGADTAIWYDNVVVATEYIGPVNLEGNDPDWRDPSTLPDPTEPVEPVIPVKIIPSEATVERGGSQQFAANVLPSLSGGESLYVLIGGATWVPRDIRVNAAVSTANWSFHGSEILFNTAHGHNFDLSYFKPDMLLRVYYNSPYSPEKTQEYMKFMTFNYKDIPDTYNTGRLSPDFIVPIVNWDENNTYFDITHAELAAFYGTPVFSYANIREHQFAIIIFNEDGDLTIGDEPITVIDARLHVAPVEPVAMIWSVDSELSSIDETGLLTVAADEDKDELVVTAAIAADPEIFGEAFVTVVGSMVEPVDKSALEDLLYGEDDGAFAFADTACAMYPGVVPASAEYAMFLSAIADAETVFNSDDATQDDIDAAYGALYEALAAFKAWVGGIMIEVTLTGVSNAKYVSIIETSKNSRVWELTFTVTLSYSDGSSKLAKYCVSLNGNNANLDGKYIFGAGHDLAGYTLVYDIKGNGSNIKDFKIIR